MINVRDILKGFWYVIFKDSTVEYISRQRLSECSKCPQNHNDFKCKLCGCFLQPKSRCVSKTNDCPLMNWTSRKTYQNIVNKDYYALDDMYNRRGTLRGSLRGIFGLSYFKIITIIHKKVEDYVNGKRPMPYNEFREYLIEYVLYKNEALINMGKQQMILNHYTRLLNYIDLQRDILNYEQISRE